MPDFNSTCYKKNALNQVIVRVDFLQYVQSNNAFCESIEKEILRIFPNRGKDQIIRFNSLNIVFDNDNEFHNANGETQEGIQREYISNDGLNKLIYSNKFMIFEINKYSTFNEHKQWFQSIFSVFFQKNRVCANRTGIRYINIFDSLKIKPQKKYFISEISSCLYTKTPEKRNGTGLLRSMHIIEYRVNEMTMNFRYGMFNPEYPNFLKKNDFVLDFDFFSKEIIDSSDEILRVLDKGHDEIQAMFEHSITDSLREVMSIE